MREKKGITLVALVVTIVILIILAVIAINFLFGENGLIDRAKQARFYHIISSLEEIAQIKGTDVYLYGKTIYEAIPNYGALSEEEKNTIVKEIPTLNEAVYKATGETVYDRDLYWLNTEENLKDNKKYIIDMNTLQVYDYEGDVFLNARWHTLNIGISIDDGEDGGESGEGGEIPDGYMRIHLDYPEDSTDRQWRIGRPGETRTDGDLIWQDYTGPILVKIDDIKNIWIRYNLKGVEVVQAPSGTLAVDIRVNPLAPYQEKVTVDVYFEPGSTNQKVKVGNGGWRVYEGPFEVTENCTIEAMAEKEMEVTDQNGNSLGTTTIKGKDSYKITNIGEEPINQNLPAPIIDDIGNQGGEEKTTARVTYPQDQGNIRKVYKINSGLEQDYVGDIKINEWGTELIAYYYTESGDKSPEARKTFNDPTVLNVDIFYQPNPALDDSIKETTVEIDYSNEAESKTYKIDNGQEQDYTGPFKITQDCTITAYAKKTGVTTATDVAVIKFKVPQQVVLQAPRFSQANNQDNTEATVTITYDTKATIKKYSVNAGELQDYTTPIENLKDGDVVYAYCEDEEGNSADGTYTVNLQTTTPPGQQLQAPRFSQANNADNTLATVTITYDTKAVIKQYKVNNGGMQDYTTPIENLKDGDIVYAYCEDAEGNSADGTYTVDLQTTPTQLQAPRFSQTNNQDNTLATVTITYDTKATIKKYNINGGNLQDYTVPIENLKDGDVVYAYCEDAEGNSADGTYTVDLQTTPTQLQAPTFSQANNSDNTSATVTITYDTKATLKKYNVNGGNLQDYTVPIENLKDGDVVYAYCEDAEGNSADGTYTVDLQTTTPPTQQFQAPIISPSYASDNSKVTINIRYDSNAVTKKYSIDGGELKDYTGPFEVTENGTVIYAVNTSSEGEQKDTTYTVSGIIKKLDVKISVNPDTTDEVEKVTVTIDYDEEATEKVYSINSGASQNYTGPFEVTENCTIVAEAKATDAYGKDTKQITNLPQGLAAPVISMTKTTETEGEVANITITYDKRSISNTYSINTDAMQNYTSGFQVRENGTVINAYSVDKFGNTATAQYVVNDLVRYLLIDKGKYYWILLPYPENSINRQYKYKEDGVWKAYKEDGFILVKSEYEDELIQGGKPIKLEVEPGRYVDFDGHWYILDSDPQKLQEDIYMKWDDPDNGSTPRVPLQILAMPAPPEKTDKVDVFIIYPATATAKQYKIDDGAYQNYTGKLEITKNNTTITAKTQYSDGSWSEEVSYTVTNIDENIAPEGIVEINAEPKEWTKDNVTVTISYNPNSTVLKKKYKIGTGSWQYTDEYSVTLTIDENTTIYAALENAAGESSEAVVYNVENIDKEKPVISSFTATNVTENSITVEVQATDEGSGLADIGTYKYYQDGTLKATIEGNIYTFENLEASTSYMLRVEVFDKAGNMKDTTTTVATLAPPDYVDSVVTSSPKLSDGMTPVKWTGTNWVKTDSTDPDWYNYTEKKWANVVLGDSKFNGNVLDETKPYSMLVWIPRYAYQITSMYHQSGTGAGNINIVFIDTANQNKDKTKTYSENYPSYTTGSGMSDYVVHPAFNFGTTKLPGFWVGKYETSNTNCTTTASTGNVAYTGKEVVTIRPNVTSWRYITGNNIFTVCTELNREENPYGLNIDDNVVDPHLMKNTEWGAVAYLSKSEYGKKTEEVWKNTSSSYITGSAGTTVSSGTTNAYNTTNGMKASTTGNIYGVYDMSGGADEYVAAYIDNGNLNLNSGSILVNAPSKYKDVYNIENTDSALENYEVATPKDGYYGDAIWETSNEHDSYASWYLDKSYMPYKSYPFLTRGGHCTANPITAAGVFSFSGNNGQLYNPRHLQFPRGHSSSFRLTLHLEICIWKADTCLFYYKNITIS